MPINTPPTQPKFGMFEQKPDGTGPVSRENRCVCGKAFTQSILSAAFLESMERMQKIDVIAKQIPGFWCPKYCPSCERKDLALEARRVDIGAPSMRGAA